MAVLEDGHQPRADALVLVAEAALGEGLGKVLERDVAGEGEEGEDDNGEASSTIPVPVVSRAERYQVVVHVSAETLAGDISAETRESPASGQDDVSAETSGSDA